MKKPFTERDIEMYTKLLQLSQKGMQTTMSSFLKNTYLNVIETDKYIVAIGDIPIALVAHMDTVFARPPKEKELRYNESKNTLWGIRGAGHDDRAGIFAIIKIIQRGLRPSIILTTDEERGGIGAAALSEIECPIEGLKYLIQLDRRGRNDCVFYECDNTDFIRYIETFGFVKRIGSFSDISFLCPEWNVCGVNLSVGYRDEHTYKEILYFDDLKSTIDKVIKMLSCDEIPDFEYVEKYSALAWANNVLLENYYIKCACCGEKQEDLDVIPVINREGGTVYYCLDCIISKVQWCDKCGEAFETKNKEGQNLCEICRKEETND